MSTVGRRVSGLSSLSQQSLVDHNPRRHGRRIALSTGAALSLVAAGSLATAPFSVPRFRRPQFGGPGFSYLVCRHRR
jgi:hypothetical protein